jgi:hypothetical protein
MWFAQGDERLLAFATSIRANWSSMPAFAADENTGNRSRLIDRLCPSGGRRGLSKVTR